MTTRALYEELSSADSCIDAAELYDLIAQAGENTQDVPPIDATIKSPSPIRTFQPPPPVVPTCTHEKEKKMWSIRVQGETLCEIANTVLNESQCYRLYFEANNQLLALQQQKSVVDAERKNAVDLCEKLYITIDFLSEQSKRLQLEAKLREVEMEKKEKELAELKKTYDEYKACTKTLVRHMQSQNKKGKKETK